MTYEFCNADSEPPPLGFSLTVCSAILSALFQAAVRNSMRRWSGDARETLSSPSTHEHCTVMIQFDS
jgi:hypothetical protein